MKDKNLPNNYNSLSIEELTIEVNKIIEKYRINFLFINSKEFNLIC